MRVLAIGFPAAGLLYAADSLATCARVRADGVWDLAVLHNLGRYRPETMSRGVGDDSVIHLAGLGERGYHSYRLGLQSTSEMDRDDTYADVLAALKHTFDPQGILARTRSRVYDGLNRLAREIGAQAQTTVHTYDGNGNRLTTTDPLSHATTSSYDALNRLLTMTDPGLGVTSYAHDNAGNLTGVTDPRNLTTTYGHDGLGNPVSQVSPDTGITTRTFDAAGNAGTAKVVVRIR